MPIRPATPTDAAAIARVRVDSWRATYRGIMPDAELDNLSYAEHTERWHRHLADEGLIVQVAVTDDGRIIGFASGGCEVTDFSDFTGEVYAIYLDPAYIRQGIGTQLIRAVARVLRDRGHESMLVWVLADNPSRHFYEALGGEFLHDETIKVGGVDLVEWAYGWREIDVLVGEQ
jgi:GNAT superfamily N-acetyltransferase